MTFSENKRVFRTDGNNISKRAISFLTFKWFGVVRSSVSCYRLFLMCFRVADLHAPRKVIGPRYWPCMTQNPGPHWAYTLRGLFQATCEQLQWDHQILEALKRPDNRPRSSCVCSLFHRGIVAGNTVPRRWSRDDMLTRSRAASVVFGVKIVVVFVSCVFWKQFISQWMSTTILRSQQC
jgi:hypothetical protein